MGKVSNIKNVSTGYAFRFGHNPDATGGQVNSTYGGVFGQLTAAITGAANGFLFTTVTSGTGATAFWQFQYSHVTCQERILVVFVKGDDIPFHQIEVSRIACGTGGHFYFPGTRPAVGNVIHNMNLSKQDGAAMQIIVAGDRVMGNSITYNGVDFTPDVVLSGGSLLWDNKWTFLGRSNYTGGWNTQPYQNLWPLPNVDSTDPDILDHYSEVYSLLPTLTFGGASVGITYSEQHMRAIRIGGVIVVSGTFTLSSKGTSTGVAKIEGLSVGGTIASAGSVGYYADLAAAVASPPMLSFISDATILLRKAGGASAVNMTDADFTNTTRIDFSVTCVVA